MSPWGSSDPDDAPLCNGCMKMMHLDGAEDHTSNWICKTEDCYENTETTPEQLAKTGTLRSI